MKKRMKLQVTVILILVCMVPGSNAFGQVIPLAGAHAHNDYNNERPLLDALSYGFTSIEVDVLLFENELYVGHELSETSYLLPTLTKAYLHPLDSIIRQNGGVLYPGYNHDFYLMIDIKTDAEETYKLLNKLLQPYQSWIKQYKEGFIQKDKITVFLSGNRPVKTVLMDSKRLVSLDGRPGDLGKGYSTQLMPIISQSYYNYSKWNGSGDMPGDDQDKIRTLAENVHSEGKLLRLWSTPDFEKGWYTLQSLGVDIINTDNLNDLRDYLIEKESGK